MKAVDTTLLIDILRGDRRAVALSKKLDELGGAVTTEINVFELLYGIYKSKKKIRNKRILQAEILFSRLAIFPLDHLSALKGAKVLGDLSQQGQVINVLDALIAGILLANRCETIITRNVTDFQRVPGLRVESY